MVAEIVKKSVKKLLIINYDSKLIYGSKMMVMWSVK